MAVVISDSTNPNYNGKMSTANAYYRVEAHQLSNFTTGTGTQINTKQYIPVTFANAGNCKGVIINPMLASSASNAITTVKDITVELEENVAGTWTVRASKTLSPSQLINNPDVKPVWTSTHQPFVFPTPYAVDTTASKWRFSVINTAITYPSAIQNWSIRSGPTTTAFMFATWCDNQVSLVDGDTLIVKDTIEVNTSRRLDGILSSGSGDTTNGIACIICKSDDPTPSGVCKLKWETSPASSYTLAFKGVVQVQTWAGIQIGTEANRIPFAQRAIIDFQSPAAGTVSAFKYGSQTSGTMYKANLMVYGEKPAVPKTTAVYRVVADSTVTFNTGGWVSFGFTGTTGQIFPCRFTTTGTLPASVSTGVTYWARALSANAQSLHPTEADALANTNAIAFATAGTGTHTIRGVVKTAVSTGWSAGSLLWFNKGSRNSPPIGYTQTISSISGDIIIPSSNPISIIQGGTVYTPDAGYGVRFKSYQSQAQFIGQCNNFVLSGADFDLFTFAMNVNPAQWMSDGVYTNRWLVENIVTKPNNTFTSQPTFLSALTITEQGITIRDSLFFGCRIVSGFRVSPLNWDGYGYGSGNTLGIVDIYNNENSCVYYSGMDLNGSGIRMYNNKFYNANTNEAQQMVLLGGTTSLSSSEIHDNLYYGSSGVFISVSNIKNINWYNETFEDIASCLSLTSGRLMSSILKDFSFTSCDFQFLINDGCGPDIELQSPTGNPSISQISTQQSRMISGSKIRYTDSNDVANVDFIYTDTGNIVRCGTELADTTVHNGGYSLRMESITTAYNHTFTQTVPTGNIQNKDMMVGVWVKLNNSAYWAGTHQMPRITVDYDNGTTVYGEAAQTTDWQFIFVPFKPTTTYGQITVTLSTNTDATSTNRYVYFDDMSVLYPAGHTISLGNFNLWANALPVTPSISTTVSAQDVWSADPTQFGAGTVGQKVNDIKNDTGLIPATL